MQTIILYIGRDTHITEVMDRLINSNPAWKGICVCTDEEALDIFNKMSIELVLLGNGIDYACEEVLRSRMALIRPEVKVIQHYGGGSGLLFGEIQQALQK